MVVVSAAEVDAPACECFWTDPSTWLSAASCGYGGGYEPGSQMEWNPDCPAHPPTYSETRFACRCGRFLAPSAIRNTDHRDDSRYYGIRTEVEWDCSRCGIVKGDEWEPQIVATKTRVLPTGGTQ